MLHSLRMHPVFTWQQARAEYTHAQIQTFVRRGEWVRVFRGVYRAAATPMSPVLALTAAQLSMDTDYAVACRHTAAQLHGIAVLEDPLVHVLASEPRTTRTPGLIVHRDRIGPHDIVATQGVWTTSATRTALDLARTYARMDALAVLDLARRRGFSQCDLESELLRHKGKRGCRQAAELVPLADPRAESPMESRTRLRCIDAELPAPTPQVVVRFRGVERRLDLAWPQWRIGLDYDSTQWHTGIDAATRDNPRHNWLADQGWQMFYATSAQVYRGPEQFTEPIRRAITRAQRASA